MILEIIPSIVSFIISMVEKTSYLGIFLGMTIESSFFPFPSEVILIPAGILAAKGQMDFFLVFLFGVLGSLVGALINYFIAFFIGRLPLEYFISKYGKFIFLKQKTLNKSEVFFNKHGEITIFIGRLIPGIRQLISLPAGFAKMNLFKFSLFTVLGAGIWSLILILIGYLFQGNLTNLFINILTLMVLILALIVLIIYLYLKKKKRTN